MDAGVPQALDAFRSALALRTPIAAGHRRVTHFAVRLGQVAGLAADALLALYWGSQLHDIGKLAIPDEVLCKRGPLTDDEWRVVRQHPEIGYRTLARIGAPVGVLEVVRCHHERWDGIGYPRGLRGEGIPALARVMAVADAYDAMTTGRPYHPALPADTAIEEIIGGSGKQFDPGLVLIFATLFPLAGSIFVSDAWTEPSPA